MADLNVGDVTARLRAETTDFQRAMADAAQRLGQLGQSAHQTQQQLSQLPLQAVTNAIDQFARSLLAAGNSQEKIRAALAQAQVAMQQFGVTTTASGAMVDKFGTQVSKMGADQLRQFAVSIQEVQREFALLQRFGIDAGKSIEGFGTTLRTALAVAGGIGIATSIGAITSTIKRFVEESVTLAAKMQDLHLAFRAIEGSATAANQRLTFLFDTAQRLGVDFVTVADGFKRLDQAAKGTALEGDAVARVFVNVVSGARVLGVSSQETQRAIVSLEQILTKGKLSAEEYRKQLGNAIPGALQLMASGLGITTKAMEEMIRLGIIPGETAAIAFGNAMGALRGKSGVETLDQLSATFARLKNETTAWMTAIGEGLGGVIQPFLQDVIRLSAALRTLFGLKPPGVQAAPGASTQGGGLFGLLPGPLLPGTLGMPAPGTTGPDERPRAAAEGALAFAHSRFDALITREAARVGEDAALMSRLIQAESRFDPRATGPPIVHQGEARGLGQIMPRTGGEYGLAIPADFYDPEKNVTATASILRDYRKTIRDKFGTLADETRITLAAYNAGIGDVVRAIEETRRIGETVTYQQVLGRLPGNKPLQTGPYVERIAGALVPGPGQSAQATAMGTLLGPAGPAPAAEVKDDPLTPMLRKASEVAQTLTTIQKTMENIGKSGLNTGDVLGKDLATQADDAKKKFSEVGVMLASWPEAWARMQPAQREVVALAGEMAAKFGEEGKVRDILKAQAESLEQLTLRRRADIVVLDQGREAGERFLRAETQALATRRVHEESTRVVGTIPQEIARYQAQIKDFATQADALGREVESRKPDTETLAQIRATGQAKIDAIEGEMEAFQALKALNARYTQPKEETDLERALLLADKITLKPLVAESEEMLKNIKASAAVLLQVPELEAQAKSTALAFHESQIQNATLQRERDRLEQLQTPKDQSVFDILAGTPSRQEVRQRQKDDLTLRTPKAKAEAEEIRAAIAGQERLNYLLSVSDQLASSAAQSWITGLQGIVAGTQSVAGAFKAMAASILNSLGQIAAQESFRALFRLGVGLIAGALTTPASTVPASPGLSETAFQQGAAQAFAGSFAPHASGGMVTRPTRILAGESSATNPEWIVNHPQMQSLLATAVRSAPSAGGQAVGGNITVINVATPQQAEAEASKARARGDEVIMNTIMRDVARGESSQLVRGLRTLQR